MRRSLPLEILWSGEEWNMSLTTPLSGEEWNTSRTTALDGEELNTIKNDIGGFNYLSL